MRRSLLAAVAATVALLVSPASAAQPGAGTAAVTASRSFRPGIAIVAVGECTYAGYTLSGVATATSTPPGTLTALSLSCTLHSVSGAQIGAASASAPLAGVNEVVIGATTVIGGGIATQICATVSATSSHNGVGTVTETSCGPVLPGNPRA